jgi:membrane protein
MPKQNIFKRSLSILSQTAGGWVRDNAMRLSASLSLYTILSLAPLLVITFKLVGLLLRNKDYAQEQISRQLVSLMGPQAADAIRPILESGSKPGHGVLAATISSGVLVFSATGVFAELQNAMNIIWQVQPKPNQGIMGFIRNRLLSVGMVFGIAFLLLVSMFVSTVLATMTQEIAPNTKGLAFLIDITVSFGVVSVLFAAIFKFLPDVKVPWRHVWLGAVITAALFTVGKYGLTLYFKFASPTSAFGASGSLVAVLLWVYYSSFILFFGAEFTKVWAVRHDHRISPADHARKIKANNAGDNKR